MKNTKAQAIWKGTLKDGSGQSKLNSTGVELDYSFATRFGDQKGSNPEELLAAAHAECYSMALSGLLTEHGFEPKSINTTAEVKMETVDGSPRITEISLHNESEVPDIDEALYSRLAVNAKVDCPISQALSDMRINMTTNLIQN